MVSNRLGPPAGARIVVSGGCGGIGRVLVQSLLDAKCQVAVLDIPASLGAHPTPSDVLAIATDATDESQVRSAVAKLQSNWGAVDGFANLCGFTLPRKPLEDYSLAEWREVLQGNLDAAFLLSTRMLPLLRQGQAPAIVHVASSLAVKASPGYGPYASAKGGMLALTRMLATENAPAIRVNAVAPNAVRTAFLTGGTGRHADKNKQAELLDLEAYGNNLPLQRAAEVEDVVGPVMFLLGHASAFMTGQTLHINGGLWQP